ncbi:tetratricopeptide repeat protein [Paraferrimonas haliotis]|uniref:MSHA biogenesis protein MshN n=1 Tax=Paraferrimonas haliotis TaxID=2013866 RepID=A0AA37WXB2_9GAMM|nr:hypothetical protein [Paraferrimonas haliotis]GLS82340.1 hypothetical protein GCM10007894_03170 [Paraferrimonas haliotis]
MSVINQMLKELDQRRAEESGIAMTPYQPATPWFRSKSLWSGLVIGGALVGTAFAVLLMPKLTISWEPTQPAVSTAVEPTKAKSSSLKTMLNEAGEAEAATAHQNEQETDVSVTAQVEPIQSKPVSLEVADSKPEPEPKSQEEAVEVVAIAEPAKQKQTQTIAAVVTAKPTFQLTEVKLTPEQRASKSLASARQWKQQGELEKASEEYSKSLLLQPHQHQVRNELAALLFGIADTRRAMEVLQEGLLQFPEQKQFGILQARILQQNEQPSQALQRLVSLNLKATESHTKGLILMSELAQTAQNHDVAAYSFDALTQLQPSVAKWWIGKGYALDSQGQSQPALSAYKSALLATELSADARQYLLNRINQLGG